MRQSVNQHGLLPKKLLERDLEGNLNAVHYRQVPCQVFLTGDQYTFKFYGKREVTSILIYKEHNPFTRNKRKADSTTDATSIAISEQSYQRQLWIGKLT